MPENKRILYRIGVNLGNVLIEGEDILGDGVNIAARLESIAEPGGICISGSAFDNVRGKIEADFLDLGEPSLKNIAWPLRVYAIKTSSGSIVAELFASGVAVLASSVEIKILVALPSGNSIAAHWAKPAVASAEHAPAAQRKPLTRSLAIKLILDHVQATDNRRWAEELADPPQNSEERCEAEGNVELALAIAQDRAPDYSHEEHITHASQKIIEPANVEKTSRTQMKFNSGIGKALGWVARPVRRIWPHFRELQVAGGGRLIITEYPYRPRRRDIEASAFGLQFAAQLQAEEESFAAQLQALSIHADALSRIPRDETDPVRPFWANSWFPPLDAAVLYGLIATRAPKRYVEVGSGISTRFARQAIRDNSLETRIVSIDPHPRSEIDQICDEVLKLPMEKVGRDFWEALGADDIFFVDNSHRSFQNSDVTVFFTEVLPALPSGTLWGLHDITLPWDYPAAWRSCFYNEQYLLAAYLAGGAARDETTLPLAWISNTPTLHNILGALWRHEQLFEGIGKSGSAFWMQRRSDLQGGA